MREPTSCAIRVLGGFVVQASIRTVLLRLMMFFSALSSYISASMLVLVLAQVMGMCAHAHAHAQPSEAAPCRRTVLYATRCADAVTAAVAAALLLALGRVWLVLVGGWCLTAGARCLFASGFPSRKQRYFLSSVLLMRMNLPLEFRVIITEVGYDPANNSKKVRSQIHPKPHGVLNKLLKKVNLGGSTVSYFLLGFYMVSCLESQIRAVSDGFETVLHTRPCLQRTRPAAHRPTGAAAAAAGRRRRRFGRCGHCWQKPLPLYYGSRQLNYILDNYKEVLSLHVTAAVPHLLK